MANASSDSIAKQLVQLLVDKSMCLAAAESCTAGLIADAISRIPGASECFWGSFVCYTPQAKMQMLGIRKELLSEYGLVSAENARAMALAALKKSGADLAVSVTGIAGPGGDGSGTLPGTVWIGTAFRLNNGRAGAIKFHFSGSRNSVRQQAARDALEQILLLIKMAQ
jgi:PncC family amidohydrolase